jgi:hypothetical protein
MMWYCTLAMLNLKPNDSNPFLIILSHCDFFRIKTPQNYFMK